VYVFTGNSYGSNGYDGVNNFSESVLKLDPSKGLALKDWFTPSNWQAMDTADSDLTSSGPTLIPGTTLLAGGGKTGIVYLLNTANLGHESSTDAGAVQELTVSSSNDELRGGPAWWQRSAAAGGPLMYNWSANDSLKAWSFNGSTFATVPVSQGTATGQTFPGGILTLSANGEVAGTGVIWASTAVSGNAEDNPPVPGELHAYDASNLTNELWNSAQNASRDAVGNFAKYTPPLVVNGRVYLATQSNRVAVYGLLPPAATPTFSPLPGTYSQPVSLSDATPGAAIYYTLNSTTPTTSSTLYTGPITLNVTTTIKAMAVASGYANSPVATGTYVIGSSSGTVVSLTSSANVDAFVNNGTAPPNGGLDGGGFAYSATLIGSSLSWNGSTFSFGSAGVADAVSNITLPLPAGNYTTLSLLGTGVNGNQPNQVFTVNYSDGTSTSFTQSLSDWFTPQNYAGESQALTMPYRIWSDGSLDNHTFYLYGYSFALNSAKTVASLTLPHNRNVVVLAVDVSATTTPVAAAPTFSPAPGTYSAAQSVTLSDTTPGASIYYTTNGTTPTTSSTLYTSPITVSASTTIKAIAVASGYINSSVASATYTINVPTAAAPTFSPAPGNYSQPVSLSDTTPGAAIYYTLNGTTPTTSSTLYTGPITLNVTTTIKAMAVASGYANSPVATGTYVIGSSSGIVVSLTSSANVVAFVNNGTAPPNGGLDGGGFAYSATLIGSSLLCDSDRLIPELVRQYLLLRQRWCRRCRQQHHPTAAGGQLHDAVVARHWSEC
jgi:hypothetical protein